MMAYYLANTLKTVNMIKNFTLLLFSLGVVSVAKAQTLTLTPTTTNITCNGLTNGAASIAVSGCPGPYNYTVNGGQQQVANTSPISLSGLSAGSYTVVVNTGGGGGTTTLFQDNFDGPNNWTLNTAIGAQGAQSNLWEINDTESWDGVCGSGNLVTAGDKTLHITCQGTFCLGTGALYNAGDAGFGFSPANTDKFSSVNTNINTTGYTDIHVKFAWRCQGQNNQDYGQLRYSTNGGSTWTDLPTKYQGSTAWSCADVTLPVACENIATLRIGFRWINDNDGAGTDPAFAIDDLLVTSGTGSGACNGTTTFTITEPAPFVVTTNVSGNVDLCSGEQLQISATNGNGCNWSPGGPGNSINVTSSGVYVVTCQNQNGCSGQSAPIIVSLISTPSAGFTYSQINNYQVNFTSTAQNATSYNWAFPGGSTSNLANPSFNFPNEGNFDVTLIVTNSCGSDTITLPVTVIKTNSVSESTVFSQFDVFPNPATDAVTLQLNSIKPIAGSIRVISATGQIVAEEIVNFNATYTKTFDLSSYSTGLYSIVVTTGNNAFTRKLMIK